jgi:cobalt-zinc-cadmium efflux system protein
MAHLGQGQSANRQAAGRLSMALGVILVFMVVEVAGGIISGSLALLADATHMLTDALALGIALSAQWIAGRPARGDLHFGYRRIQVLAAFVNGIALLLLMAWICVEALKRAYAPVDVSWRPMLAIALLGLLANGIAFRILHRVSGNDINVRGAMLHVVSDLVGSVAAVMAALIIAWTGYTRIDPILSFLVAALIARSAIKLLRDASHVLLEGAPPNFDIQRLVEDVKATTPDIADIHNVRVWQLTPGHSRLTMHARLKTREAVDEALAAIKLRLAEVHGIEESTIQIEFDDSCPDNDPAHADLIAATRAAKAAMGHDCGHDHGHDHGHAHGHSHGHPSASTGAVSSAA